jgi:hypothetical protein
MVNDTSFAKSTPGPAFPVSTEGVDTTANTTASPFSGSMEVLGFQPIAKPS